MKLLHDLKIFFISILLISFLLMLGLNPLDIGIFVGARLGQAVGLSVSVPENPFNKLAVQLSEKERDLAAREQALAERENEQGASSRSGPYLGLLTACVLILFILVCVNYYLDYRRRRVDANRNTEEKKKT